MGTGLGPRKVTRGKLQLRTNASVRAARDHSSRACHHARLRAGRLHGDGRPRPRVWQPWEAVIICGAALGTFLVANPMKTVKDTGKGLLEAFKHAVPKERDYLETLGVLHSLMRELRTKSRNEVEAHIDNPGGIGDLPGLPDRAQEPRPDALSSATTAASSSSAMRARTRSRR